MPFPLAPTCAFLEQCQIQRFLRSALLLVIMYPLIDFSVLFFGQVPHLGAFPCHARISCQTIWQLEPLGAEISMPDKGRPLGSPFDFGGHERTAISDYLQVQPFYDGLSNVVARIIEENLKQRNITVHSVQHRAKEPRSFGRKAATPSETDPDSPKYPNPLQNITDLAGIRVITHLRGTLAEI